MSILYYLDRLDETAAPSRTAGADGANESDILGPPLCFFPFVVSFPTDDAVLPFRSAVLFNLQQKSNELARQETWQRTLTGLCDELDYSRLTCMLAGLRTLSVKAIVSQMLVV